MAELTEKELQEIFGGTFNPPTSGTSHPTYYITDEWIERFLKGEITPEEFTCLTNLTSFLLPEASTTTNPFKLLPFGFILFLRIVVIT